jgi:Ca-activated chloride channel family protein
MVDDGTTSWAAQIPELVYDLIARVLPGFLAILLIINGWLGYHAYLEPGRSSSLSHFKEAPFNSAILWALGLLIVSWAVGLLVTPVADMYVNEAHRSRNFQKMVTRHLHLMKAAEAEEIVTHAMGEEFWEGVSGGKHLDHSGSIYQQLHEFLKDRKSSWQGILTKNQAEAMFYSNTQAGTALFLLGYGAVVLYARVVWASPALGGDVAVCGAHTWTGGGAVLAGKAGCYEQGGAAVESAYCLSANGGRRAPCSAATPGNAAHANRSAFRFGDSGSIRWNAAASYGQRTASDGEIGLESLARGRSACDDKRNLPRVLCSSCAPYFLEMDHMRGWSVSPLPTRVRCGLLLMFAAALLCGPSWRAIAQENPLDQIHTQAPAAPKSFPSGEAKGVAAPSSAAASASPSGGGQGSGAPQGKVPRLQVDVNLVLVPVSVTDPRNRLVTGLERDNFQIFDNNVPQQIRSFTMQDAPLTIGIIFDLSGSMNSKFTRARRALSEFLHTANPQDEFFVIGFNDRPAIIVDFTSDPDDVEARMVMLKPEKRTALIDAIYLGASKMRQAKYERRALLVVSDGGDNRSRYTPEELRRAVRESDLQIDAIGIFDPYAPTEEERDGPLLLNDICEMTGGRLFRVTDVDELSDIAAKISAELRNQYLLGFRPSDIHKDSSWRKLRVRLAPPPGLPPLTAHFREGYYSPSQ